MVKYKIQEEIIYGINNGYYILTKKHWWSFWQYVKHTNGMIAKYSNRRAAQAYINLRSQKK
jgi:hypothetical protein